MGERTGSNAEFDLNSGILESVMDIFRRRRDRINRAHETTACFAFVAER